MHSLFFWNIWQKAYKQLYWSLLVLFFATITFFCTGWSIGVGITFPWEVYAQSETIKVTIDSITSGPFQLPMEVENYLLTESFQGGDLTTYKWPSYVFVAILAFIFTLAITCVTTLTRFWYLVGMSLIIAFLMSLQLESLQLFGRFDKSALIGVFALYLPLSYYYHSIRKTTPFTTRLMTFSLVTTIVGFVIFFTAEVQYPFLHLAAYGYVAPVIISIFFILMIGHQVLAGFMYIITANNNAHSKNSLWHFLIFTSVYLLNLLIIILNKNRYLDWEMVNIHPFVLLLISSLIGMLLYKYQEETYKHIYSFYPIGGFVYLMLGSICFFTIGYYLFSGNDAIISVFEAMIFYAHFGYGLVFLMYILASFLSPLGRNMQVYKVLYKSKNMPYFTYRLAGTIVVLAFVLVSNYKIPVFHVMSTYYNRIGDLHFRTGEQKIAEGYYLKGKSFDYGNHRANYTLGRMARNSGDNAKAAYYFNEAIRKRPTPQAFVNMGNVYLEEGKFFDGLFTIQDGKNKFPNSDRLKINLGLLYDKAGEPDSAYLVFDAAQNRSITKKSAQVNILSLINKGNYVYDLDSIMDQYVDEDYLATINNGFVLYNANQQFWNKPMIADTLLNLITGCSLYNQSINNIYSLDSGYLSTLAQLALIPENVAFREKLLFATAFGYYYHQEVEKAFRLMAQLANNYSVKSHYYFYVLGLWSLDQEAPLLAVDFFRKSQEKKYFEAKLALAIATMETGAVEESKELWEALSFEANPIRRKLAIETLQMLSHSELNNMNDPQKYWYWKYQVNKESEILLQEVIDAMTSDDYKSQIFTDLMKYFLDKGDTAKVFLYAKEKNSLSGVPLTHESYWMSIAKNDLMGKADTTSYQSIFGNTVDKSQLAKLNYYKARSTILRKDTIVANKLFEQASANPFFEQGVIGKAKYLSEIGEQLKAYNVLLNALEINPYAINLRKQYVLQCATMGFKRYGNYALEEFQSLISSQEYRLFEMQYKEKLKETEKGLEYFEDG